jgi:hypothetical protein
MVAAESIVVVASLPRAFAGLRLWRRGDPGTQGPSLALWIASSQALLAMTMGTGCAGTALSSTRGGRSETRFGETAAAQSGLCIECQSVGPRLQLFG